MIKTFLKRLFPRYQYSELRQTLTDLYYKNQIDQIENIYNNSTLPKVGVDIILLSQLNSVNLKTPFIKYALVWEKSEDSNVEWIMHNIIRNVYFDFSNVKNILQ